MRSDKDWLELLLGIERDFRCEKRRSLGLTAELGELWASINLRLTLEARGTGGYDAEDEGGERVQIKARAPKAGARQISNSGRIGRFSSWNFDYALLVEFDGDLNVVGCWRADVGRLQEYDDQTDRSGMHVSTFKKAATPVKLHQ